MDEGIKTRIFVSVVLAILLIVFMLATRYEYSKTPTNTIPIFERLDKWTGEVKVTNYVSKNWKGVQAQQAPLVPGAGETVSVQEPSKSEKKKN
ncbi:MAG: hypothetical protein PHE61_03710 [Candidatus Omnitrophica bacterium]|nr:hypothetical protein [Candidatus Omnitrophota bacterium]